MPSELHTLLAFLRAFYTRLKALRENDTGYTTEAVIITAVLAGLALAVLNIIYEKVTAKAQSINLNGN